MNKNTVSILFIITVIAIVAILLFNSYLVSGDKDRLMKRLSSMPAMPLLALDSIPLNLHEWLSIHKHIIIILFDPACDHCQNQVQAIKANATRFENTIILLISSAAIREIAAFSNRLRISDCDNILLGKMNEADMSGAFGHSLVPHTFIYDKNRKLLKEFRGEVAVEQILNSLE